MNSFQRKQKVGEKKEKKCKKEVSYMSIGSWFIGLQYGIGTKKIVKTYSVAIISALV
jgi:hypothetical protein